MFMKSLAKIGCASAVVVALLAGTGAVAAADSAGGPTNRGPAVVIADQPDGPGGVDTPEPGDTPDQPGE
jgi:hypothetical protein